MKFDIHERFCSNLDQMKTKKWQTNRIITKKSALNYYTSRNSSNIELKRQQTSNPTNSDPKKLSKRVNYWNCVWFDHQHIEYQNTTFSRFWEKKWRKKKVIKNEFASLLARVTVPTTVKLGKRAICLYLSCGCHKSYS